MVASALLRNSVSIEKWLDATTFVKKRNTVLWKKLFPSINYSNLQKKNVFQEQLPYFGSQSFLMSL